MHNKNPRIQWRMAVIESLITGADGLVRTANIRTCNGRTNRLITKLYHLEVTAKTNGHVDEAKTADDIHTHRPDATLLRKRHKEYRSGLTYFLPRRRMWRISRQ